MTPTLNTEQTPAELSTTTDPASLSAAHTTVQGHPGDGDQAPTTSDRSPATDDADMGRDEPSNPASQAAPTPNRNDNPEHVEVTAVSRDVLEEVSEALKAARDPEVIADYDMPIFPPCPDKSDNAEIWKTYVRETDEYDKQMIAGWSDGIGNFLIFTGLFSAILSAFLIYSWTLLQQDSAGATVNAMVVLSQQLANLSSGHGLEASSAYQLPPFSPPLYAIVVNGLWFTGLFISLLASVTAMLVKEWLNAYTQGREVVPLKRVEQRQLRYNGLMGWRVPTIVTFLPLAIHFAAFLFFTGLALLAWPVSTALSIWMAVMLGIGFCAYCASALAPIVYEACPYKSPLYTVLDGLRHLIAKPSASFYEWLRHLSTSCTLYFLFPFHLLKQCYQRRGAGEQDTVAFDPDLENEATDLEGGNADLEDENRSRNGNAVTRFAEFKAEKLVVWEHRKYDQQLERTQKKQAGVPSYTKAMHFALQAEALVWLVKSPDEAVNLKALEFLSWWRMPNSWWMNIRTEAHAIIEAKLEGFEFLRSDSRLDPGEREKLLLLSPLALPESYEYRWVGSNVMTSHLWPGHGGFNLNELLMGLPSCDVLISLRYILMLEHPSEFVLCLGLEQLLRHPISTREDVTNALVALDAMVDCLPKYPTYNIFLAKYLELLALVLEPGDGRNADRIDAEDWKCCYPKREIYNYLWDSMGNLFKLSSPDNSCAWIWERELERVVRIRCGLMGRLLHSHISDQERGPYDGWRIGRWLEDSLLEISDQDTIAIRHLVVSLMEWFDPTEALSARAYWILNDEEFCNSFAWMTIYVYEGCSGWTARRDIHDREGRLREYLDKQEILDASQWVPVIVVAFQALHGVEKDDTPPTEDQIRTAVADLLSMEWMELVSADGMEYMSSHRTENAGNWKKLCGILEECLKTLFKWEPAAVLASGVLDKYSKINAAFVEALLTGGDTTAFGIPVVQRAIDGPIGERTDLQSGVAHVAVDGPTAEQEEAGSEVIDSVAA